MRGHGKNVAEVGNPVVVGKRVFRQKPEYDAQHLPGRPGRRVLQGLRQGLLLVICKNYAQCRGSDLAEGTIT